MTVELTICPRCSAISETQRADRIRCDACANVISRVEYEELLHVGRAAIHYGITYRRRYQLDHERYGKLPKKYLLPEPSIVLSFLGAAIVGGIVGNAAYDAIRFTLRTLAAAIQKHFPHDDKDGVADTFLHPGDLDILFQLISSDNNYAQRFFSDITEYLEGLPKVHPEVRDAICEEKTVHETCKKLAEIFNYIVFVTPYGHCYHRFDCPQINDSATARLRKDVTNKHKPCRVCKPDGA